MMLHHFRPSPIFEELTVVLQEVHLLKKNDLVAFCFTHLTCVLKVYCMYSLEAGGGSVLGKALVL